MTDSKLIDKLTKIKNMAEGAKAIGSEQEAQAFAELLQKMLLDHKLHMSDIEFAAMERDQPVTKHFIDYDKYPGIKVKLKRVLWIEKLAGIVAEAHFCRILVYPNSSVITLVGRPDDCAVAEFMFMTLQRAAARMSKTAAYQYLLKCKREGVPVGHGFRDSWLEAFVVRLAQRYLEELKGRSSDDQALMRIKKSQDAVDEFMNQFKRKASSLSASRKFNPEGVRQGRDAANKIHLKANGITGKETAALRFPEGTRVRVVYCDQEPALMGKTGRIVSNGSSRADYVVYIDNVGERHFSHLDLQEAQ